MDYHDPSVGHARLALAKLNAQCDPGPGLGAVFFKPGMFVRVLSVPTSANSAMQVVLMSWGLNWTL